MQVFAASLREGFAMRGKDNKIKIKIKDQPFSLEQIFKGQCKLKLS